MPMENTARLFNCARCHIQVIICSQCDRGNIYCSLCSSQARTDSLRRASLRYQNTLRGKHNHAERQKKYTRKKMTHHGSQNYSPYDELHKLNNEDVKDVAVIYKAVHCHFCGQICASFLRLGFLRYRLSESNKLRSNVRPLGP